jgi:ATP-dependent DNA helicase RecQ
MNSDWRTLLARYWGPEFELRSHQQAIVEDLCAGRDVLALLPTGEGKSLCFQLAALVRGGLTVVISPLLALMEEQVEQLVRKGLPAVALNSRLSPAERRARLQTLGNARAGFLYLAPEQLQSGELQRWLQAQRPDLLIVDEAHCISQWGNHFRPAYRQISALYADQAQRPVIGAFTATAPPAVAQDICQSLALQSPQRYQGAVLRDNIAIDIRACWTPRGKRRALHQGLNGKTLIYARSRQACEQLAAALYAQGQPARFYHAGCAPRQRQESYQHFRTQAEAVLVATTAFGMGVDIPDIATVIHWDLPESLEAYVQEIGRGGRNRQFQARALALMLRFEARHSTRSLDRTVVDAVWKQLGRGLSLPLIQDQFNLNASELNALLLPWLTEGLLVARPGLRYQPVASDQNYRAVLATAIEQERSRQQAQSRALQHYLRAKNCRRAALEAYFGTPVQPACGHCDLCRQKR